MIWRVESDLVAMFREHGLETFEFLCGYSVSVQVAPINSCLYEEWVFILIGSTLRDHYIFTDVSYRGSHYIVSYTIVNFVLLWFDVLISGILQIGPAALLVPAPQPLYRKRSGVVSVFWTVRLVCLAHLAFQSCILLPCFCSLWLWTWIPFFEYSPVLLFLVLYMDPIWLIHIP